MTTVIRRKEEKQQKIVTAVQQVLADISTRSFTGKCTLEMHCQSGGIVQIYPTMRGDGLLKK